MVVIRFLARPLPLAAPMPELYPYLVLGVAARLFVSAFLRGRRFRRAAALLVAPLKLLPIPFY